MATALQQLSHSDLIALVEAHQQERAEHLQIIVTERGSHEQQVKQYEAQIGSLKFQLAQYERLVHGSKRERFLSDVHTSQLPLGLGVDTEQVAAAVEAATEEITYERRTARKKHEGRMALPGHLPVVETVIEPEGDLTGMKQIGVEVTDELEITPASMYIKRTIRPRLAAEEAEDGSVQILIAPLPLRPIDKCLAGVNLLTTITVDKHVHHLPIDRQLKRFSQLGVDIPSSTAESWQRLQADLLSPLHAALRSVIRQSLYLQVDETGLAVQDRTKNGTTHKGFLWGYHAPLIKAVYFDYQKGRGQNHCRPMLENYKGYLQTDDYQAYHQHKARDGVIGLACWAHARRNFDKALDSDRERATIALNLIQRLYAVEREARDGHLPHEARKELRLDNALPVINLLGKWLAGQIDDTLPKSPIGKAVRYAVRLWDELQAYLYDGRLEIDNNLMENAIRPVALGRKNWLFAGSHDAAQNIAMYRSFFGTCHLNGINPYDWLRYVLENIRSTPADQYHMLLPHIIGPALLKQ